MVPDKASRESLKKIDWISAMTLFTTSSYLTLSSTTIVVNSASILFMHAKKISIFKKVSIKVESFFVYRSN